MDLTKFDVRSAADKGADLHLKHPSSGDPLMCKDGKTPFTVRVLGRDSKAVQDAAKKLAADKVEGTVTQEESGARMLMAAVCGWCDEMEMDGEKLPYSPENARKLMLDPRTDWMAEQITPFSLARSNFAKNMKDS